MANCRKCGNPVDSGVVFHAECVPAWRPASEPPENDREVLVVTRSKKGVQSVDKGYHDGERWIHRGSAEVTHWMELPELPEVVKVTWTKTGRTVYDNGETDVIYTSGDYRIESRKRRIPHNGRSGYWMHTTYHLSGPGVSGEYQTLRDAKAAAEVVR